MSILSEAFDSKRGTEPEKWLAPAMEHPLDVGIVFDGDYDGRSRSNLCSTKGTHDTNAHASTDSTSTRRATSHCGHRLRLSHLINYLSQSPASGSSSVATTSRCPICQAPIIWVVDGVSATMTNDSHVNPEPRTICFKYGKQFYKVSTDTRSWFRTGRLSQHRIATVLSIHVKSLKIISKGKVIYPDSTKSEEELSQTILMTSARDKSKPSLVVMGTRVGSELRNSHQYPYALEMITWMVSVMYGVCCQKPSMDVSRDHTTCPSSVAATPV